MRVVEAFSGVGSQTQALKNIGVEHEVVAILEIDKFAIKSYQALHGKVNNLGDIKGVKTEEVPAHDLFTYSFPCTDISTMGLQGGLEKGSGTSSSLLWESYQIIKYHKPKYLLMENVKALINKKNRKNFEKWGKKIEALGYTNYWEVLNGKHFGVPQNRERVFMVSILGEHTPYTFPKKRNEEMIPLHTILDEEVDMSIYGLTDLSKSRYEYRPKYTTDIKVIGTVAPQRSFGNRDLVYSSTGISGALLANDFVQPKQVMTFGEIKQPEEEVLNDIIKNGQGEKQYYWGRDTYDLLIRRITPREYWRMMGFTDEEFGKVRGTNSNTQLYKQAGNSIVVNVLEDIFKEMVKTKKVGKHYKNKNLKAKNN